VSYSHFAQLYRSLMFDAQKSVSHVYLCLLFICMWSRARGEASSEPYKPHQSSRLHRFSNGLHVNTRLLKSHKIHRLTATQATSDAIHTHTAGVISATSLSLSVCVCVRVCERELECGLMAFSRWILWLFKSRVLT